MSTGSALPDKEGNPMEKHNSPDGPTIERMTHYRTLSALFMYPDDAFFSLFPGFAERRDEIEASYDRLFRGGTVWLFGAEHLVENEFQRAKQLADIVGFYTAFGVEPNLERPDALPNELEFMHYLILKAQNADDLPDGAGKRDVCEDAQRKFFSTHFYPAARIIVDKLLACDGEDFYGEAAQELGDFIETEKMLMDSLNQQ